MARYRGAVRRVFMPSGPLSFIFLDWFPNGEFNIVQKLEYLHSEAIELECQRTSATGIRMGSLAFLIGVVMFKGLD